MLPYNDFESRLAKHPKLYARFAELLHIAEAPPGHLDRADDAEESIVESLRQLGRETLEAWAQHQEHHLRTQHDGHPGLRRDKKTLLAQQFRQHYALGTALSGKRRAQTATPLLCAEWGDTTGLFTVFATHRQ
jgi:hypothetical protein